MAAPLADRRVLITGAAGGFGRAISLRLEAMGATVVGLDRTPGPGIVTVDLRDPAEVEAAVAEALARLGGLDILINNAGVGTVSDAGAAPGAGELEMLEVNLLGSWRVTAAALPALLRSRGRVVNIASGLAVVNLPLLGGYMASKRALTGWADALRLQYGSRLRAVTTVLPGYVRTGIHARAAAAGFSMEGLIPAEPLAATVDAVIRACQGRPRREIATTRRMRAAILIARILPGTADAAVSRLTRSAVRAGRLEMGLSSGQDVP